MTSDLSVLGPLMLLGIFVAVVLVISWIILPFAILGTKPLLRQLLEAQQHTNRLLAELTQSRKT